jgi:Gluconate 2-dehydrogenase subunit 3
MTRRQWFLQLGGGAVLTGWSGVDLSAAELPPGLYGPSREHLGHALAGHPMAANGETELVQVRSTTFDPAFFSAGQYRTVLQFTALLLGEPSDTPVIHEIVEWMDLTLAEAPAVRTAARALSPANRTLAIYFYGAEAVRKVEEFDPQKLVRDGLAWLETESQRRHGRAFSSLARAEQVAILSSLADDHPEKREEHPGERFFVYCKERVIHGFYTSRAGLEELGYRGNAYYASPPGCEHLYG